MKFIKGTYSDQEKRTFQLHLIYSIIEGIILGVLALNEFVFIKSLKGSNYELGFLFQFSMVVFIFLVFKEYRKYGRLLSVASVLSNISIEAMASRKSCTVLMCRFRRDAASEAEISW